jgi:hypothetical protein
MSAKGDDYVKNLQNEVARLEAEKKAISEEFEKVIKEDWTPEVIREKIRTEILPSAWVSLQDLIMNGESEATRSTLIKWAFETASKPLPGENDPQDDADKGLTELLKELSSKEK